MFCSRIDRGVCKSAFPYRFTTLFTPIIGCVFTKLTRLFLSCKVRSHTRTERGCNQTFSLFLRWKLSWNSNHKTWCLVVWLQIIDWRTIYFALYTKLVILWRTFLSTNFVRLPQISHNLALRDQRLYFELFLISSIKWGSTTSARFFHL